MNDDDDLLDEEGNAINEDDDGVSSNVDDIVDEGVYEYEGPYEDIEMINNDLEMVVLCDVCGQGWIMPKACIENLNYCEDCIEVMQS